MGDLSPHFNRHEFTCPHCGQLVLDPALLPAMEELRSQGPEPVLIHDAYRCPEHNLAVGGVAHSEHPEGKAVDCEIVGLTLQQMYDRAKLVPAFAAGGIGVYYQKFIHVDVRSNGPARWARVKDVEGYVALERLVTP